MITCSCFCSAFPNADVQSDKITQLTIKVIAKYPVNFFNTSAVDVPNTEDPASPPNEAPKPKLLDSWIKITKHKSILTIRNKNKKR